MKAGTIVAMLLVLALVIPAISGCAGEGPSGEEIVVCTISGLTGGTAGTHLMCDAGWKDYIRYVNEVKGGFKGKNGTVMLKNISYDSEYKADKAKEMFARASRDDVVAATGQKETIAGSYVAGCFARAERGVPFSNREEVEILPPEY